MEQIRKEFDIPVKGSYDVAVVGGGPAGFCAAVAAARGGAKTVLIEQNGFGGGMATSALVGPFMTSFDKSGDHMIIRGLYEEVIDRLLKEKDGAIHPGECEDGTALCSYIIIGHKHVAPFDPEILKRVIDAMLTEAGVHVLYHTSFVEPLLEDNAMVGLITHAKNGLEAIKAKVVIDASGDADVAYRAGVPCELGDEASGRIQPATMFFRIGNVDFAKVEKDIQDHAGDFYRKDGVNYRSFHWHVAEAKAAGDWTLARVAIGLFRGVKEDEWNVNTSRIMGVNGLDNESLSGAEITGRLQVKEIYEFLKKYIPGCENAKLLGTGSAIGIRETRHIRGEKTVVTDDILEGKIPEDAILLASNSIDVHGRYGPMSNEYVTVENGEYYGIPFGALVPVNVDGLLVAGRSISATSEAAGSFRVMPPCMEIGHAAGVAAALAVKEGIRVRDVDRAKIREQMVKEGSYLGGELAKDDHVGLSVQGKLYRRTGKF